VPGAALVGAAILLIVAVLPHAAPSPSPSAAVATPTPTADHEVTTDEGVVSFRFEDGAIVIRLAESGTTRELGRATLPFLASAPPGGTVSPTGSAGFVMVCGPVDGPDSRRYVFGRLDPGSDISYTGPDAVGHGASDGLFLYALRPGSIDPAAQIEVRRGDLGGSVGFSAGNFARAIAEGERQPSGCYVTD
jgi:hypothetical protein